MADFDMTEPNSLTLKRIIYSQLNQQLWTMPVETQAASVSQVKPGYQRPLFPSFVTKA